MLRSTLALAALAFIGIICGLAPACSGAPATGLEIDDFSYLDTSGEPTDQAAPHQTQLRAFMAALRGDVEKDHRYHLVSSSCVPSCTEEGPLASGRLRAASEAGAKVLITGAIQKMSTLVQWARVSAINVDAQPNAKRILFEKLYTFRGDSDEAWRRAEAFVSQEIRETLASLPSTAAIAAPEPIRLAVFAFEFEDTSAASNSAAAIDPADAAELVKVTDAVRGLFAQSSEYRVVDVSAANADVVKAHALHDCGGCDAKIALRLGADQSLTGVVRRVSRTEYTVRFQLRESRTGAVVASADSGLRMGANYSWSRGAVRLVSDRLLQTQSKQ